MIQSIHLIPISPFLHALTHLCVCVHFVPRNVTTCADYVVTITVQTQVISITRMPWATLLEPQPLLSLLLFLVRKRLGQDLVQDKENILTTNFSDGEIYKWVFPLFQKNMLFGQSKAKKKKKSQCYVVGLSTLLDWSSNFKFISLGCFGVAMGFCYCGYCSACFVFNSCTGAFDDKSCWALSQSGPELHRWLRNEGWAGEGGAGLGNSAPSSPLSQRKTELPPSFHLKPNQPLCLPRNAHWAWLLWSCDLFSCQQLFDI